jgi:hypothetical protein
MIRVPFYEIYRNNLHSINHFCDFFLDVSGSYMRGGESGESGEVD